MRHMLRTFLYSFGLLTAFQANVLAQPKSHVFDQLVLSEDFYSEGACLADINADGHTDVVSGPYWYAGPEFRIRHAYAPERRFSIKGYSDHFFTFAEDFNNDGQVDLLTIPIPGLNSYWFENPGKPGVNWKKYLVLDDVGNESPTLTDLTGDGQTELVCCRGGTIGYASRDADDSTAPWKFTPISDNRGFGRFTHGLGVGDLNDDGRNDILERSGWWEQPEKQGSLFQFHSFPFAQSGGAQIFAYDFDGDGDNDVISSQNAHGFGLTWFERRGNSSDVAFIPHPILTDKPEDNLYGLSISQMHAVTLADVDGDGIKDVITGKRYWAHGGGDPGAQRLPVLYWFRTVRNVNGVEFQPRLISKRCGVGTQITVGDATGNGLDDILIGNKLGTFLLQHKTTAVTGKEFVDAVPAKAKALAHTPGTNHFASHVRETDPLTPSDEQKTFVLPQGFEIQLVASEPDIAKPMNMAFDRRGRLWVSSSSEYPIAAPADRKATDTINILEDTNGDGRADIIKTFADDLNIPMGLYPYKDGVVCFSIPNIWFLRDTDGDDRVDKREKLYGPFDTTRDTHGMCNAFTRGLDGWLYACHGFNNQSTVAGADGNEVVMHSGNTFRFKLDGSRIEHFTHGQVNPFGMAIDQNGDCFSADCHTKPISLLLRGGYHDSFGKPHDGLGYIPNVMEHLHGSTAIGGIALGEATNFPDVYRNSSFGGNVATSRINRNSLIRTGSTIKAQEEPDFLISGDPWFRPADLQVAPDGSLYVTDFYNRVIGHYEVKLDDPRRDRSRGRIWRIVYKGSDARRDHSPSAISSPTQSPVSLTTASLEQLIEQLDSRLKTKTDLTFEAIVQRFGKSAEANGRLNAQHTSARVRAASLWLLFRCDRLRADDVAKAIKDKSALVRTHTFRILAEMAEAPSDVEQWLATGLKDDDALTKRAAAMASASHNSDELIDALLDAYNASPKNDVHLRHAIRMALRNHLQSEILFSRVASRDFPSSDVQLIGSLCMSLKTPTAGEFVAAHIEQLAGTDHDQLAKYIKFAVGYVTRDTISTLAQTALDRFGDDLDFQLTLLTAVKNGLSQRGVAHPESVRAWATVVAEKLLDINQSGNPPDDDVEPLSWTQIQYRDASSQVDSWTVSHTRKSADGMMATPLWSSFPRGERRTGIYRSAPFLLPDEFSFFLAGHDGFPDKPLQQKNYVEVRDALSREVLERWSPHRNDTAQQIKWKTRDVAGRQVFIELVDGNADSAYAWLAVGRFSVEALNPSHRSENRRKGAELAAAFKLDQFRNAIGKVALKTLTDPISVRVLAAALSQMTSHADARMNALAESTSIVGLNILQRREMVQALMNDQSAAVPALLLKAMLSASTTEQRRVAEVLASDSGGAALLVQLAEAGRLSARLLKYPQIEPKLLAAADDPLRKRITALTSRMPDESENLIELIASRRQDHSSGPGDRELGTKLFARACATCHQIAGLGKKVGPNLDGIGNRGLDRLVEDILAPNRNVDVAFRTSTIVTDQGRVLNGLIKRTEGARMVLVDSKGEEISVATDTINQNVLSNLSPMPANFGETLSEEQFRHLIAYLLSLRSS